jgi:type IX secretion system PorP/SprF family membrane protein
MLPAILSVAQSNIRLNNDWNNTYFINPASIDDKGYAEFNMAARKQWVGFDGSPTTLFASGRIYLENQNTQYGLKILQDKVGFTSVTDVDATYAYNVKLSNYWRLNLGVTLTYQSVAYDTQAIKDPTGYDPVVANSLLNEENANSDIGFELTNKSYRFGVSSQSIFSLVFPINKLFLNTNYVYAIYRDYSHDYFNLGYGVCGIQYAKFNQLEFNLTGYFKATPETHPFQIGVIYRTSNEIGALFGFDFTPSLRASYSYDYNFTGISNASFGTHELMLTYRLDKVFHCKDCWH